MAKNIRKRAPALDPDAREAQLINLAMNRAEEQLQAGTASSQVITHFLRLATEKTKLERDKIAAEVALANAKVDAIRAQQTSEQMYQEALEAFRSYGSTAGFNNYEDGYEYYN